VAEDPTEVDATPVVDPQEVVEFLAFVMRGGDRNTNVKQSDRVVAAAGLTNYFLAVELGRLIELAIAGPEGL
jgi:hypothetical protein